MTKYFDWASIHRPTRIADAVLLPEIRKTFEGFIADGELPNMTLAGPPGIGKTTVAIAALEELGRDYLVIGASLDRGIDTLRNDVSQFASTISFSGGRKYVILDEADNMTSAMALGLRNFINEFEHNCGFILTCNYKDKIPEPIRSRCPVIEFKVTKERKVKFFADIVSRVKSILDIQGVTYDSDVVMEIVKKHFPDMRLTLNTLQKYAASSGNKIDSGILASLDSVSIKTLIDSMKKKDFTSVRKWVSENSSGDHTRIFRIFYDNASKYFAPSAIPYLVLILSKYQHQAAFVADPEVNLAACMAEIMLECEYV